MTENAPLILNMGKTKRKRIRQLKRGRGRLVDDVREALDQVSSELGAQASGKEIVPVVLIYRRKRKKRGRGNMFLPFF